MREEGERGQKRRGFFFLKNRWPCRRGSRAGVPRVTLERERDEGTRPGRVEALRGCTMGRSSRHPFFRKPPLASLFLRGTRQHISSPFQRISSPLSCLYTGGDATRRAVPHALFLRDATSTSTTLLNLLGHDFCFLRTSPLRPEGRNGRDGTFGGREGHPFHPWPREATCVTIRDVVRGERW